MPPKRKQRSQVDDASPDTAVADAPTTAQDTTAAAAEPSSDPPPLPKAQQGAGSKVALVADSSLSGYLKMMNSKTRKVVAAEGGRGTKRRAHLVTSEAHRVLEGGELSKQILAHQKADEEEQLKKEKVKLEEAATAAAIEAAAKAEANDDDDDDEWEDVELAYTDYVTTKKEEEAMKAGDEDDKKKEFAAVNVTHVAMNFEKRPENSNDNNNGQENGDGENVFVDSAEVRLMQAAKRRSIRNQNFATVIAKVLVHIQRGQRLYREAHHPLLAKLLLEVPKNTTKRRTKSKKAQSVGSLPPFHQPVLAKAMETAAVLVRDAMSQAGTKPDLRPVWVTGTKDLCKNTTSAAIKELIDGINAAFSLKTTVGDVITREEQTHVKNATTGMEELITTVSSTTTHITQFLSTEELEQYHLTLKLLEQYKKTDATSDAAEQKNKKIECPSPIYFCLVFLSMAKRAGLDARLATAFTSQDALLLEAQSEEAKRLQEESTSTNHVTSGEEQPPTSGDVKREEEGNNSSLAEKDKSTIVRNAAGVEFVGLFGPMSRTNSATTQQQQGTAPANSTNGPANTSMSFQTINAEMMTLTNITSIESEALPTTAPQATASQQQHQAEGLSKDDALLILDSDEDEDQANAQPKAKRKKKEAGKDQEHDADAAATLSKKKSSNNSVDHEQLAKKLLKQQQKEARQRKKDKKKAEELAATAQQQQKPQVPPAQKPPLPKSWVWCEVYCPIRQAYISVNPCAACATMWNSPYVLAFGGDHVVDVTPRYVSKFSEVYGKRAEAMKFGITKGYLWTDDGPKLQQDHAHKQREQDPTSPQSKGRKANRQTIGAKRKRNGSNDEATNDNGDAGEADEDVDNATTAQCDAEDDGQPVDDGVDTTKKKGPRTDAGLIDSFSIGVEPFSGPMGHVERLLTPLNDPVKCWSTKTAERMPRELNQLDRLLYADPVPTTQKALKSHPLYILETDLGRFEAVYPRDGPNLVGNLKGTNVFKRSGICSLRSLDGWIRVGRVLKSKGEMRAEEQDAKKKKQAQQNSKFTDGPQEDDEEPVGCYKELKPPPSRPFAEPTKLYGYWQTKPFKPLPTNDDGTIPKHENTKWYLLIPEGGGRAVQQAKEKNTPNGNTNINNDENKAAANPLPPLPEGLSRIQGCKGIQRLAQRMGTDLAFCVIGFVKREFTMNIRGSSVVGTRWEPLIDGVVVKAEDEETLRTAYDEWIAVQAAQEAARRRERAMKWWDTLIRRGLAHIRLISQFGDVDDDDEGHCD